MNALFGWNICFPYEKNSLIYDAMQRESSDRRGRIEFPLELWDPVLIEDDKRVVEVTSADMALSLITLRVADENQWLDIIAKHTTESSMREGWYTIPDGQRRGTDPLFKVVIGDVDATAFVMLYNNWGRRPRFEVHLLAHPDPLSDAHVEFMKLTIAALAGCSSGKDEPVYRVRLHDGSSELLHDGSSELQGHLTALLSGDSRRIYVDADSLLATFEDGTRGEAIKTAFRDDQGPNVELRSYHLPSVDLISVDERLNWKTAQSLRPTGGEVDEQTEWKTGQLMIGNTPQDVEYIFVGERDSEAFVFHVDDGSDFGRNAVLFPDEFSADPLGLMTRVMEVIRLHTPKITDKQQFLVAAANDEAIERLYLSALVLGDNGNLLLEFFDLTRIRSPNECDQQMNKKLLDKARTSAQGRGHSAMIKAQTRVQSIRMTAKLLFESITYKGERGVYLLMHMGPGRLSQGSEADCNNSHETSFKLFKSYDDWSDCESLKNLENDEVSSFRHSSSGIKWGNSVLVKDKDGFRAVINDDVSTNALKLIRSSPPLKFTLTGHYDRTAVDRVMNALFGWDICLVNNKNCPIMRALAKDVANKDSWSSFLIKERWDWVLIEDDKRVVEVTSVVKYDVTLILRLSDATEWGLAMEAPADKFARRIKNDSGAVVCLVPMKFSADMDENFVLPRETDTSAQGFEKSMGVVMKHFRDQHKADCVFRVVVGEKHESSLARQILSALILADSGKLLIDADSLRATFEDGTRGEAIKTIFNAGERIFSGRWTDAPCWPSVSLSKVCEEGWKELLSEASQPDAGDEITKMFQGEEGLQVCVNHIITESEQASEYSVIFLDGGVTRFTDDWTLMTQVMKFIRDREGGNITFLIKPYSFDTVVDLSMLSALVLGDEGNLLFERHWMDRIRLPGKCDQPMNKKLLDKARTSAQGRGHSARVVVRPPDEPARVVVRPPDEPARVVVRPPDEPARVVVRLPDEAALVVVKPRDESLLVSNSLYTGGNAL
eukprot:GHVS01059460.1.p1 GENE.GHVS01059460.1~~GHVS01059460.1.p1  ORF type:complete len:1003 (+),score=65.57 GHVS01059460.1:3-3011(+)